MTDSLRQPSLQLLPSIPRVICTLPVHTEGRWLKFSRHVLFEKPPSVRSDTNGLQRVLRDGASEPTSRSATRFADRFRQGRTNKADQRYVHVVSASCRRRDLNGDRRSVCLPARGDPVYPP